jgi:hypothetical protein
MSVESDGVPTNHHELGACIAEGEQEIAKVVGKLDHVGALRTNLQGICARAQTGSA